MLMILAILAAMLFAFYLGYCVGVLAMFLPDFIEEIENGF